MIFSTLLPALINFSVTPAGSRISRVRALIARARLSGVGSPSLSMILKGMPRRFSSIAAVRPTGPAPIIRFSTGFSDILNSFD